MEKLDTLYYCLFYYFINLWAVLFLLLPLVSFILTYLFWPVPQYVSRLHYWSVITDSRAGRRPREADGGVWGVRRLLDRRRRAVSHWRPLDGQATRRLREAAHGARGNHGEFLATVACQELFNQTNYYTVYIQLSNLRSSGSSKHLVPTGWSTEHHHGRHEMTLTPLMSQHICLCWQVTVCLPCTCYRTTGTAWALAPRCAVAHTVFVMKS